MTLRKAKRTRHGTGAVDVDSEDEIDIDTTAIIDPTSGNITLEPRLYTSKRPKSDHVQSTSTVEDITEALGPNRPEETEGDMQSDKKRKQVCFIDNPIIDV